MTGPVSYVRPGDWVADPAACTLTFAVRNFRFGTQASANSIWGRQT